MKRLSLVALGSNATSTFGTTKEIITHAIAEIERKLAINCESSRIYQTPCFPKWAGPDYANAAIRFETDASAQEILQQLHEIENEFGRVRTKRWGERSIDLDLIAVDGEIQPNDTEFNLWLNLPINEQTQIAPDQLILPHPRIQDRAFVLVPLAEIAPDWRHPVLQKTVRQMLADLDPADIAEVVPYA